MHIISIVVTRNVSVSVKSLHSLLNLNKICAQFKHTHDINFVRDDPVTKNSMILKSMKHCDRLVFIDYGVYVDDNSLVCMTEKFPPGYGCFVCPCVTDKLSWDLFKKKILSGSTETVSQMALEFDTEVSNIVPNCPPSIRNVVSTVPRCWAWDTKMMLKSLKGQKGEGISLPLTPEDLFKKIKERGVRICAFTDAKLVVTFSHECVGNILESANVKVGDGNGNVIG
jgi:hypothetical protein